jgi:hypothetical protein
MYSVLLYLLYSVLRTEYVRRHSSDSTATERSYGRDGFDSTSCSCAARLDRPDGGRLQERWIMDHG